MAHFTIQSRAHGEIRFVVRDDGGYIRVYSTGLGLDGKQPCEGGGFMGSTLMSDAERLERDARRWWKQYLAGQRAMHL